MSFIAALVMAPLLVTQEAGAAAAAEAPAPAAVAADSSPAEAGAATGAVASGESSAEERIRALEAKVAELSSQQESFEEQMYEEAGEETARKVIDISGFFDLSINKMWVPEDSLVNNLISEDLSFVMQNINLYIASQMTDTLSALIELHFTFKPLGEERSFEVEGMTEYEREDTTVTDLLTNEKYALGGLAIERAQLTWQPADFFGVIAGRFLTPYGIWNVDHGSPVLLMARYPTLKVWEIVPSAQTGLQIFGRFFPARRTYFDYAFTVSNGRGPIESVLDLDDNKGLGLRLKLAYEGDDFKISGGAYGYWGEYTDNKKAIVSFDPFRVQATRTEAYTEWVISGDLKMEVKGVLFQAECARALYLYDVRPERNIYYGTGPQPDYTKTSVYGLVAYTLPLDEWLGDMTLTPFFQYGASNNDDSLPDQRGLEYRGGLNFKPSRFVVLKAEAVYLDVSGVVGYAAWGLTGQMAVSF